MVIDVHGFKRLEAKEYIMSKIDECIKKHDLSLTIIHGFNYGTAIKDWLINSKSLNNVKEIIKKDSGTTILVLSR